MKKASLFIAGVALTAAGTVFAANNAVTQSIVAQPQAQAVNANASQANKTNPGGMRHQHANMTPEQRAAKKAEHQAKMANMTDAERAAHREARAKAREAHRAQFESMTPEQRAEHRAKRQAAKANKANGAQGERNGRPQRGQAPAAQPAN